MRSIAQKEGGRQEFGLKIAWIAAHSGAKGNEMVDKAAKEAAEGFSDPQDRLPAYLAKQRDRLPISLLALKQAHGARLRQRWRKRWTESPRYERYNKLYEDSRLFSAFKGATRGATRNQLSLLIQLHTGHVPLNSYLHRIQKWESA
ncbi:hypothetical protein J132_06539 [Termitomyces sp. J132]|nr:hypothetical protein J132_06539 [Termitomyces sp. J132]